MNNKNLIGQQAMEKSIEILSKLWDKKIIPNKCQNERYLHHYYSKEIQEHFEIDFRNLEKSKLHPEWPTYKNSTGIECSKYRKTDKKYIVAANGSSGFIDFSIGKYHEPEFAIEFTSKYGFGKEDFIYDFMKLLDEKNPFKNVISFNLIFRKNDLPKGRRKEKIRDKLDDILIEITDKKRGRNLEIDKKRVFLFWIIEIDPKGKKRHWFCKNITFGFEEISDIQEYKIL